MPRGRAGVLPGGTAPLRFPPRITWGCHPALPRVRGFFENAMPTNSATIPSWAAPVADLWQRALEPDEADLPRSRVTRCCTWPVPLFALAHHLHVDQRALPGVGAHGPARPSHSARVASAVAGLGGAPCAAGGNPATALTKRPAPARLAGPDRGGRVRVRRRARRSRSVSRSCGASTAWPAPTSSPRWSRSRSAVRTSSAARIPTIRWSGCHHAVKYHAPGRAGLSRGSCPICRSWRWRAFRARSGPTTA